MTAASRLAESGQKRSVDIRPHKFMTALSIALNSAAAFLQTQDHARRALRF